MPGTKWRLISAASPKTAVAPCTLGLVIAMVLTAPLLRAQTRPLLTQRIDENILTPLAGNTPPEIETAEDYGVVADDMPLEHLLLQLQRPPEQEQALNDFLDQLNDPSSPNFHHWLTAEEFGERFGLTQYDLDTISAWLGWHGFLVNAVYPNRMLIDFSGTAGQVRDAFHTEIHHLAAGGSHHISNIADPRIPAALAPAVVGIVSLHNFMPQRLSTPAPEFTVAGGCMTPKGDTVDCNLVAAADLATIYNLNPLFTSGITGMNQTIAVINPSNLFSAGDWGVYRKVFGLARAYPGGSFSEVHPNAGKNCTDPEVTDDGSEATLDAELASAAAPNASIQNASCADTATTSGVIIALQNVINGANPPPIISVSYSRPEAGMGAAMNATINTAYQQAATAGISVFVGSGDRGAAESDRGMKEARLGISVSGLASTPNNVAVGGTDFGDTLANTNATYWNSAGANTAAFGSAKSYIPEIPWNNSCAGTLLAKYLSGSPITYGPDGFCNSLGGTAHVNIKAGGGGPSGCGTGAPDLIGRVGGTCKGYAKPAWQSIFGNPADSVRDLPDISLFAGSTLWVHAYVICYSDTTMGRNGRSCLGAPNTWYRTGGTSAATPVMAGIQALVNQKTANKWGNPNPIYYSIASAQYGNAGDAACDSSKGNAVANTCIFYDITAGDTDVPCTGANCYNPRAVESVTVTKGGTGYTAAPSCTITGGGGMGATCSATIANGEVSKIDVTAGGKDYVVVPACVLRGGGGAGATCRAVLTSSLGVLSQAGQLITNVRVSGVTGSPTGVSCNLTGGGGMGAKCRAFLTNVVTSVTLTAAGNGYTSTPTCTLTGGGGSGAECTATVDPTTKMVKSIVLLFPGRDYTAAPTCTLSGGGGNGATCTAASGPGAGAELTARGSGYTSLPSCTITANAGVTVTCAAFAISSSTAYRPAFSATKGWDFATGIGSVNATNLVMSPMWRK